MATISWSADLVPLLDLFEPYQKGKAQGKTLVIAVHEEPAGEVDYNVGYTW